MGRISEQRKRRGRAEWIRLVARWRRSGKSAVEFAPEVGVSARRLEWWVWRLARDQKAARAGEDKGMQLVPVQIEDERRLPGQPLLSLTLELTTASGECLRVYGPAGTDELRVMVEALVARKRS